MLKVRNFADEGVGTNLLFWDAASSPDPCQKRRFFQITYQLSSCHIHIFDSDGLNVGVCTVAQVQGVGGLAGRRLFRIPFWKESKCQRSVRGVPRS
jgi:hypothetical protein